MTHTPGLVGIGDNVVDHYLDQGMYYPGGNALNVAVLARRSGLADTAYVGIIGDDAEGAHVRASMLAEGLSDRWLRQAVGETGKARVTLENGDRVFVGSNKGGLRKRLALRMDDDDLALIARLGHVHSSCFSYLEPELPRIRAVARGLSFDFSIGREDGYFAQVCVTQGERGAVFSDGTRLIRQGIVPATVVDTMGAGDAFIAGLLAATLAGATPEAALPHAAACAARACGWPGAFGHPHPAQ